MLTFCFFHINLNYKTETARRVRGHSYEASNPVSHSSGGIGGALQYRKMSLKGKEKEEDDIPTVIIDDDDEATNFFVKKKKRRVITIRMYLSTLSFNLVERKRLTSNSLSSSLTITRLHPRRLGRRGREDTSQET